MKRQIRVKVKDAWHIVEVDDPPQYPFQIVVDGEAITVEVDAQGISGPPRPSRPAPAPAQARVVGLVGITQENEKIIRSPMPGRIVSVSVKVWDQVEPNKELCILETMKMEQSILMSRQGTVRAVFIRPGQNVAAGDPLIQLE
ncbi:MAG: hypothetical protein HY680_08215 [Chloroflexi bacterium]|nr:hypothetical protein [Chloroflexota bacterium]